MGLKSVPTSCDGAILFPADMPNITSSDLNRLIAKFDKDAEKLICTIVHKGVKNNPVLWSKALYHKAQIIPENANMRPVLIEHNDYIKTVEIRDAKKVLDINYPVQIKEYCKE
jgi:CTP:molybdopterin cytidylyltransferase MocA